MANCIACFIPRTLGCCINEAIIKAKDDKVLRIAKMDGKILENSAGKNVSHGEISSKDDNLEKVSGGRGVRRIKVVITKQQLQQLLAEQISVEQVLSMLDKRTTTLSVGPPKNWKPKLESIAEGNE